MRKIGSHATCSGSSGREASERSFTWRSDEDDKQTEVSHRAEREDVDASSTFLSS